MYRRDIFCIFPVIAILIAGCGDNSGKVKTTGTITLDGSKLQMAIVQFEPEDANNEISSAQVLPDGTFTLHAIKPGKYHVAVKTSMFKSIMAAENVNPQTGKRMPGTNNKHGSFRAVPMKYENARTSGLFVEIGKGRSIDLALKSGSYRPGKIN